MNPFDYKLNFVRLSNEKKPMKNLKDGSTCYEVDTGKWFIFYKNQWYEQEKKSSDTDKKIPSEFQEVEWIESVGVAFIDTLLPAKGSHRIEYEGQTVGTSVGHGLECHKDTNNRLGATFYSESQRLAYYWKIAGEGQTRAEVTDLVEKGINIREKFKLIQDFERIAIIQNSNAYIKYYNGNYSGKLVDNWTIFKKINDGDGGFRIYKASIFENEKEIRKYKPCYRKNDGKIGFYEINEGIFLTNQAGILSKGGDI